MYIKLESCFYATLTNKVKHMGPAADNYVVFCGVLEKHRLRSKMKAKRDISDTDDHTATT
ncbi:hypothetical protein [Chitinilyticum litopenaei]|uniref:hypothetical protein n=1 Tax=Chitinilyticum litopenaei TaxID=1121276 RepID=UPI001B7F9C91|nr:hypothetical protein [Chitinilyticum litopenaei]